MCQYQKKEAITVRQTPSLSSTREPGRRVQERRISPPNVDGYFLVISIATKKVSY